MIYSSVGFGGGSSYLALLALAGVGFYELKPTALFCNIVVVTGGVFVFYRNGKLDLKKGLSFIVPSIPLAFLGGYFRLQQHSGFITLAITLMVASIFLWFQPKKEVIPKESGNIWLNGGIGMAIGFISGLVGIGGGIFLSPILHLMDWGEAKKISALASFFILVNSISGLLGQWTQSVSMDYSFILPLLGAVFIGGQIGSRLGAKVFNPLYIKRITAIVVLIAGLIILKEHI